MNEMGKCAGLIWKGVFHRRCQSKGKLEHEGKNYCGTHHPPTVEAKRAARYKEFLAKFDERSKQRAAQEAADAEMRRRAECFDELVVALAFMVTAAEEERWPVKAEHMMPLAAARAALAKAKGKI